jgi:hypothetical protein
MGPFFFSYSCCGDDETHHQHVLHVWGQGWMVIASWGDSFFMNKTFQIIHILTQKCKKIRNPMLSEDYVQ